MESIKIKGKIEILVIDAKTKEIKEKHEFTNIITNNGIKMHRNWCANVLPIADPTYNIDTRITKIAVGTGNSTPAKTQTTLDTETLRKTLYPTPDAGCGIALIGNDTVKFTMYISESECNGQTLKEIGLFSTSHSPAFMVSRFLCGSLSKTSAVQFLIKYSITFS